jgi:MoaA/NifB/PqqE/SkfB family radical SAM enzyme
MGVRIAEIEINTTNACTGNCFICSKVHGYGNLPMMSEEVFARLVEQLVDIDFDVIQTSGNGDCWLHPHFLDWLRVLRLTFPKATICNYSNFALYDPERTDAVLAERLIDRQFTRIDSLDTDAFGRSTGLNASLVFGNLDYFIRHNNSIDLTIGYSSITQYYHKCKTILGHPPMHGPFGEGEAARMPDEYEAIRKRFGGVPNRRAPGFMRINQSLWAERADPRTPKDTTGHCPKHNLLTQIVWICPNGDVDLCGYDDTQSRFVVGNILDEPLERIWTSRRRLELLDKLMAGDRPTYPCNPKCCRMYGDNHV